MPDRRQLHSDCISGQISGNAGRESSRFDGDYRVNRADFGTITLQLSHEAMRDIDTKAHSGVSPKHTFATPKMHEYTHLPNNRPKQRQTADCTNNGNYRELQSQRKSAGQGIRN